MLFSIKAHMLRGWFHPTLPYYFSRLTPLLYCFSGFVNIFNELYISFYYLPVHVASGFNLFPTLSSLIGLPILFQIWKWTITLAPKNLVLERLGEWNPALQFDHQKFPIPHHVHCLSFTDETSKVCLLDFLTSICWTSNSIGAWSTFPLTCGALLLVYLHKFPWFYQ